MKKFKKIRGHHRIWKDIDDWIARNKNLDLLYLKERKRDYVKVWVSPYKNISVLNSDFETPKSKTRQKIINGIYEIFLYWEMQLNQLNLPYYLKIWHFPHDVSKNQVVCSIDNFINFYDSTFFKPKVNKPLSDNNFGLSWEYHHQEHHITIKDIGEPEEFYSYKDYLDNKKWINKIMKNPRTRISEFLENDIKTTYYSIKEYDVWVGGRK